MLLLRNVWANLGTHSPSGLHFVVVGSVGLMADTAASDPHTLFPHSDLFTASGLCTHMVWHGPWPPARPSAPSHTGIGSSPKSPDPTDKPVGGWWQPETPLFLPTPRLSPLSLPSFHLLPPAWLHKAEFDCTA